jgi:hypothetical protein
VAFLRRLQGHVVAPGQDLSDGLPVTAFPTTEQEMLRHNVDHPDAMLTATYPDAAPTWMDYPFAVLATANPGERDAAARLLVALQDPKGRRPSAGGFRSPDGRACDRPGRTYRATPSRLADGVPEDAALQRWATATTAAASSADRRVGLERVVPPSARPGSPSRSTRQRAG